MSIWPPFTLPALYPYRQYSHNQHFEVADRADMQAITKHIVTEVTSETPSADRSGDDLPVANQHRQQQAQVAFVAKSSDIGKLISIMKNFVTSTHRWDEARQTRAVMQRGLA